MRVALIHDYLTQYGGAERVLESLRTCYPDAPIFTSLVDFAALPPVYQTYAIQQSALRALPGAIRIHRALLPLYPALFRSFATDLREFEMIISDSSAWAHHAPRPPRAVHVCYCHTPARFLYGDPDYLAPARIPLPLRPLAAATFGALRRADQRAATRVDRFVANSRVVAARIRAVYGREARVVYPPVDLARFAQLAGRDEPPAPWCLVVSRLVPHKRVDLAIAACAQVGLPLKIIGDGRSRAALMRQAGRDVEFLGRLDDAAVVAHLARCRALILPAKEDFGLTAVEAQAAGRPVVALAAGGALETVIPGETGVLAPEATPSAFAAALSDLGHISWSPARARANATRFGQDRFMREIMREVELALADRVRGRPTATARRPPTR